MNLNKKKDSKTSIDHLAKKHSRYYSKAGEEMKYLTFRDEGPLKSRPNDENLKNSLSKPVCVSL